MISAVIQSFYSSRYYTQVARISGGIGMYYVFILTLIMVAGMTGLFIMNAAPLRLFAESIPATASTLPAAGVKGGKFYIDRPDGRFSLPLGKGKDQVWISVDTTYQAGDIKALKAFMEANNMVALITADYFFHFDKRRDLVVSSFKDVGKDISITHEQWMSLGNKISQWGEKVMIGLVIFAGLAGFFVFNFAAAVLGAILVWIVALIFRAGLDFASSMRLVALFRIPYTLITHAPLLIGGAILSGGVGWVVWILYALFAIFSAKSRYAG